MKENHDVQLLKELGKLEEVLEKNHTKEGVVDELIGKTAIFSERIKERISASSPETNNIEAKTTSKNVDSIPVPG